MKLRGFEPSRSSLKPALRCTNSWTGWNAVTGRSLKAAGIFLGLLALLGPTRSFAACGPCCAKWRKLPFGQTISVIQKKNYATLDTIKGADWSDDFIAAGALELEQQVLSNCEDASLGDVLTLLKRTYLRRLGWKGSSQVDLVFRGLLTSGEDSGAIRQQLSKPQNKKLEGMDLLTAIYGDAKGVGDVLVVGAAPIPVESLSTIVTKMCGSLKPCPFWDPVFIAHVVVVPTTGVAHYLPELASVRLSKDLLDAVSPLRQMVVAHELVHVAAFRQLQITGKDWTKEFARFSGWKKIKKRWEAPLNVVEGGAWADDLARESVGSPYSFEPDRPSTPKKIGKQKVDGFVLEKAHRETIKSGELGEDLADHIAAFIVAPQRFCFKDQPVAPLKYQWITQEVFKQPKELDCTPPPPK